MKTWRLALFAAGFFLSLQVQALQLAANRHTDYAIIIQEGATPAELFAARELAQYLGQIAQCTFPLVQATLETVPEKAIIIGQGSIAACLFPDIAWTQLETESVRIRRHGHHLLLAGGRPRGTLYAVYHFLQSRCGIRWWTPWAEYVPVNTRLSVQHLDEEFDPVFESRDPFWFTAFNARWAARNFSNSQHAGLGLEQGGCITYKGFVHTFYSLVPPDPYFKTNPEWFSLVNGKRSTAHAQLCLSNPQLREFVLSQMHQWLKEAPDADILSVSQNDWHGACQCDDCKAIDDREGTPAGSVIEFVNHLAAELEKTHPKVAIDTLAYQYTRKAPKTIRPHPNVIVRLCSIECNFREPLNSATNAAFTRDLLDWSRLCKRLYIWDYTTDFAHYVQPHPNWFVLKPNLQFFAEHNVAGVFEQGAYQSPGGEMGELRAWLLSQLLWNPSASDKKLIKEFLKGYYGPQAAPLIQDYLTLMHQASRGHNLTCYSSVNAPFFNFRTMAQAESLWQEAERLSGDHAEYGLRIRQAHLPLHYVWLRRWSKLQDECSKLKAAWPFQCSRAELAQQWLKQAEQSNPYSPQGITHLNEPGLKPNGFVSELK